MNKKEFIYGGALVIVGLLLLIIPGKCANAIVVLLGLASVVNGVYSIAKIRPIVADKDFSTAILVRGIMSIVVGLLAVFLPIVFTKGMWIVMMYVLAIYMIISAVMEFYASSKLGEYGISRKQYIMEGIISILIALILFVMPVKVGEVILRIFGIFATLSGAVCLLYAWKSKTIVDTTAVVEDAPAESAETETKPESPTETD